MQNFLFVINPDSGSALDKGFPEMIEEVFAVHPHKKYTLYTLNKGSIKDQLKKELKKKKYDVVVACGGDGTVAGVASELVKSSQILSIIPLGTANVFARAIQLPIDVRRALEICAESDTTLKLDAMKCMNEYYFLQITIGLSSEVTKEATQQHKKLFGRLMYIFIGLGKVFAHKSRRYRLLLDDKPVELKAADIIIANTDVFLGMGLSFGESISMIDGRIDVCAARPKTLLDYVRLTLNFFFTKFKVSKKLYFSQSCKEVKIDCKKKLPVHADGEIIGSTPVEITVVPKAISVLCPKGA
ncbi:MAG: diacylglycerol/lipid kinase family protein [Candidatus Gracilibacteria bacterium]